MSRAFLHIADVVAALGRLPGHLGERLVGLYLVGWGLMAFAATGMFEAAPFAYAVLASGGASEWRYGLVFALVGACQLAAAGPERGSQSRTRRRLAAALAGGACLVGLAVAFAHTGAWSGAYTYGMGAAFEAVIVLRLWLLRYADRRGLDLRSSYTLTATRRPTP